MLTLLPVVLLLVFAVVIQFLGRYKMTIGMTWLVTAGSVFLVWSLMIILRVIMPTGVTISNWNPLGIGSDLLVFQFSERTWIFALLLVSLLIATIFTDTTRFGRGNNLTTWTGAMVLTAVGLLSILSQTLLTVIITWSIIDVVEIGILSNIIDNKKIQYAAVVEFSTRVAGTILIVSTLVTSNIHNLTIDVSSFSQNSYILILCGAVLRLGVLPLHAPLTANLPIRRSLGTILRFVAPISVFSFLSQIQPIKTLDTFPSFILMFAALTAMFGSIKWYISQNELIGRPYWMLAFSSLIIIAFLRGQIESVIALTMVTFVCGGVVFLHSSFSRYVYLLMAILVVGMIGLPFSPVMPVWVGLLSGPVKALNFVLIISIGFLFIGLIRHLLRIQDTDPSIERWMKMFYAIGLALLLIVPWITLFWRFQNVRDYSYWYGPALTLLLLVVYFVLSMSKMGQRIRERRLIQSGLVPLKLIGKYIGIAFKFDWFLRLLRSVYNGFSWLMQFFIKTLEGDGGLLWALLFLALISSVFIGERAP